MASYTLAIHGGAGTILKEHMTAGLEAAYRSALGEALESGITLLKQGKPSLLAVKAAVVSLENNILFNAGKGSVYAKDGSQEMDASIMDGETLMAGSVAAVRNIRNPVELAYAIMKNSQHVMLQGKGAFEFAQSMGIATEDDPYFYSEQRYEQWQKMKADGGAALDHNVHLDKKKFGTVGAVALDQHGNLAAATSTGGMTNKEFGRIGDSPVIGAGTYANNKTCAISCTGHGEPFIRAVAAYDVSCLMEYKGKTLEEAMSIVVLDKLVSMNGEGGMIGVDGAGNASLVFNSEGMYRGFRNSEGKHEVAIYK